MKPAPFSYERPRDLDAALSMLAASRGSAKIIAGGQSLGPMLNLRLVQPELIVDISGLAELKRAVVISGGKGSLAGPVVGGLIFCGLAEPAIAALPGADHG